MSVHFSLSATAGPMVEDAVWSHCSPTMLSAKRFPLQLSASLCRRLLSSSSTVTEIKKVGIIGLGLMGHGVAQVTAQAGYETIGIESNSTALDIGSQRIEQSLKKMIARDVKLKKVTEEEGAQTYGEVMSRIRLSTDVKDAYDCDLVIEAIVENMDVKLKFYQDLSNKIKPSAIFASNTSSLQITNMALASGRPQNFVGLHFFNPGESLSLLTSS
jgi:3-hydroxyacyl-CoA dehydrogenase